MTDVWSPSKGAISGQGRGQRPEARGQRVEGRVPDPWQLHSLPFDEFLVDLFTCTRFEFTGQQLEPANGPTSWHDAPNYLPKMYFSDWGF